MIDTQTDGIMETSQASVAPPGIVDQNKTELTRKVTESARAWLAGIGCKPVETEVTVGEQWVADVAGAWVPTRTEAQNAKLLPRSPGWTRREARESWELLYGALPHIITVVLEVKTSVGDFRGDPKWTRPSPADIRVLSMPLGMIPEDKWPDGWWVLLHDKGGGLHKVARRAPMTPIDDAQRAFVVHQIGCRIHNRQQYQRISGAMRGHRSEQNDYTNRCRINDVVRAVLAVVRAEQPSVEECLSYHIGRRAKVPAGITEDIANLYGIGRSDAAPPQAPPP